ncbi:telomere-binding protein 1-like isoform X1 [Lolium rigidum]|uniref:telomere-binding protein 1-like isoform X1 n=1 Tax=Lolium rigidum TaxID=89674 RepID=UPI001F5D1331|nr:telomere-binding protein 1-like isoform X1 [Lolium rigidum]XP_047053278.1 telomere-binding protein 1-like isoform X1 [Lolium rigidum]XP_047053279.1 telomere-binding protein 1-like isoform X1 [Lolium rigidum]XP_047053280.1 telomere-binding protein 1-like isoform X1 [Lolium rigidum]XP_047053281.1 telomere-binding protein 1-like isoform X1 [Lolium rigidum]
MVVRKRLDYGSRGHQVPAMPRVPSSARGKRSTRRKKDEMCAFDLLATVAGSLLGDQENSSIVPNIGTAASSYARKRKSVKAEQRDDVLPLNSIAVGNCIVGSGGACASPRRTNICSAENSSTQNETDSVLESLTVEPNMLVKESLFSCTKSCNPGHGLGGIPGCCRGALSLEANQLQVKQTKDGDAAALYSLVNSVDLDGRPPALVSSDSSSGMPLCSHDKDRNTSGLCRAEVQHAADKDDDENSSGCTHPCTTGNKSYVPHYTGDSRIRKLFASKFRKAARNKMCGEMPNKGSKQSFCGNKISTTRQKVQRAMFKRKKIVRRNFTASSTKGVLTDASGASFSVEGQNPGSEDYNVKLRIKSFTIPELFIEIPENATIGSLKRTVMDVVTSIIEGGLRVGVFLEGKNIQDDSKTLRQARICHGENLDNVDFTLECEAAHNSSPGVRTPEETDFLGADAMKPLAMIKCEETFSETKARGNNQHSIVEMTMQETPGSSRAIVPVASLNAEALAIVPVCKSKRATMGQRRIRRPFSLPEVESLVDAVEQLGTGRWRDVKMLAFDNTDHRTYVDLKDKWKTLVHTASISPQQRRGEPVPQGLLDRVLVAQAYWSQQQQLSGKASGQGSSSC